MIHVAAGPQIAVRPPDPAGYLADRLAEWGERDLAAIARAKRSIEQHLAGPGLRQTPDAAPDMSAYRAWRTQLGEYRRQQRAFPSTANPGTRFTLWRDREMARCVSELGPRDADLSHPSVAYELSSGCSIGCWFCGISAERFGGHAPHATHGRLWRDILGAMMRTIGPAARTGICFWGTDPFDNPDYGLFTADHHAVIGCLPSTTTAAPLRNLALTQDLLRQSQVHGPVVNRFSLLTARAMKDVLATWSARELLLTDLVPQMAGSLLPKAQAGRARAGGRAASTDAGASTIACVTGFLINLQERRVRLVSPCRATDEWPLGYRVYADERFADGPSLQTALDGIVERCMPAELPLDRAMRLRRDLRVQPGEAAVRLQTDQAAHDVAGHRFIPALIRRLADADRPLRDVVGLMVADGASVFGVLHVLGEMHHAGLLEPVDVMPTHHVPERRSDPWN